MIASPPKQYGEPSPTWNGTKLKEAAHEAGYTQLQLAVACRVTEMTVRSWWANRSTPRAESLALLGRLLGRPIEWFFDDPGEEAA